MRRRFQLQLGRYSRFEELTLRDTEIVVASWSAVPGAGKKGMTEMIKKNGSADIARNHYEVLVAKRIADGYLEISTEDVEPTYVLSENEIALLGACATGGAKGSKAALSLISLGIDVRKGREMDGVTALEFAVQNCTPLVVQELINSGAPVNGEPGADQTPLMLAARADNVDSLKVLVENGADLELPCLLPWAKGKNAEWLAEKEKSKRALAYLRSLRCERREGAPQVAEAIVAPSPQHARIQKALKKHVRPAWAPITESGEGDIHESKFCGHPSLAPHDDWPVCIDCDEPMQLFLQLNPATLPKNAPLKLGDRLLQVFFCTNEKSECFVGCDSALSKGALCRLLSISSKNSMKAAPMEDVFPPKRIIGWQSLPDEYPSVADSSDLKLRINDESWFEEFEPDGGDKLGGWPRWIQSPDYGQCRQCGTVMHFVFQIDHDKGVPWGFGDLGRAYVTQCPSHIEHLRLCWDCS